MGAGGGLRGALVIAALALTAVGIGVSVVLSGINGDDPAAQVVFVWPDSDTVISSSNVSQYPASLSAYRHPFGTCKKNGDRVAVEFSNITVNETRLWPMYPDVREGFATEHERCHFVMARMLVILAAIMKNWTRGNMWFVTHGTLLGAVRYGGFIPWDVDIDIAMPRHHMIYLRKMWRTLLPRDMFLQSEKTEHSFHMWTGKERAVRIKDRYSTFAGMRFSVLKRGKRYKMKKWHLGAGIDIIPLEKRGRGQFKIFHNFFGYDTLFPLSTICFENLELPAPKNVSEFLSLLYGPDYMEQPVNASFGGATTLPCRATSMSGGSQWSLDWARDHPRGQPPVVFPRDDPHGSAADDFRVPFQPYPGIDPVGPPAIGHVNRKPKK